MNRQLSDRLKFWAMIIFGVVVSVNAGYYLSALVSGATVITK